MNSSIVPAVEGSVGEIASTPKEEKRRYVIELMAGGVGELTNDQLADLLAMADRMFRQFESQFSGLEWKHHGRHVHYDPAAKFVYELRAELLAREAAAPRE